MEARYYCDPETGLPHIYDHGVREIEVEGVLARPAEDGPSSEARGKPSGKPKMADVCESFTFRMTTAMVSLSCPLIPSRGSNSKRFDDANGGDENEQTTIAERLG
jgi:hypothetical protein